LFRRHWKLWLTGAVACVVLVAFGGPFVYIHLIEHQAPPPLSIGNTAANCDENAPAAVGDWRVVAGSQAGYRVTETIVGQSTVVAGRTSHVTGSVVIAGTAATSATFTVDMNTVATDVALRDSDVEGIMDTTTYPTSVFKLTAPIEFGTLPPPCRQITAQAVGKLTLRGQSKTVTFAVSAERSGATNKISGSIPVLFSDYGIPTPTAVGDSITVDDHGDVEFLLVLGR
jgi:polyisoprenoid-binding protein YceI